MSTKLGPEKIVEKEVLAMCQEIGMEVSVIDSKATYSKNLERYTASKSAPQYFPDLVGNTKGGTAVYLELKARGKLKTLSDGQRAFLQRKIDQECFAMCVDSADLLFAAYVRWRQGEHAVLQAYLDKI